MSALKESGRSGTKGVSGQRLRSAMVTVQIALALVLLIGAGLMINSFVRVHRNNLGADPTRVLTFDFRFPRNEVQKSAGRYRGVTLMDINPLTAGTFNRVWERIQGLPGVESAAAISRPPLGGGGIGMAFLMEGRPAPPPGSKTGQTQFAAYFSVTPNFFATMKIPILLGRDFNTQDTGAAAQIMIINHTMARRFWPTENPIGKRITLDFVPGEPVRQIVGVVGDTRSNRFQRDPTPTVYVPHVQQPSQWLAPAGPDRFGMFFILRASGDPLSLIPAVRNAVAEVDPNIPVTNVKTVEQYLSQQVQGLRLYIALLGAFAALATVLAIVGIYGVIAYSVEQRTYEIGIRMALGANPLIVMMLIIRQAFLFTAFGLVLGLIGAFALTRLIKSALFGITATDPTTFVGVSLLLAFIALLASFIPARRALVVEPTVALRYE